jgi:hypothetical protein
MPYKVLGSLALFTLSIIAASGNAWAQDDLDCWAGKRRTDLRTGEVRSECMQEPESWWNLMRLRQLGELGIQDRKDVAFVLEKLQGDDWDLRAEAARTLRLNRYTKQCSKMSPTLIGCRPSPKLPAISLQDAHCPKGIGDLDQNPC